MNYQQKYQDYLAAAGDQPVLPFEAWLDELGNELRKQLNTLTSIKPMRFKHDVTEIMEKCFDLQNEGKATVFLNLSGHVQQLNIRIFVPAWQEGTDAKFVANLQIKLENELIQIQEIIKQEEAKKQAELVKISKK